MSDEQSRENTTEATQDLRNALNAARDEARMRLHLFSLDAREKWGELEQKLFALENKLQSGAEGAASGLEAAPRRPVNSPTQPAS